MSEEGVEHRLTTILAADVVGYSRFMGKDETGMLAHLEGLKVEILDPLPDGLCVVRAAV